MPIIKCDGCGGTNVDITNEENVMWMSDFMNNDPIYTGDPSMDLRTKTTFRTLKCKDCNYKISYSYNSSTRTSRQR